MSKVLVVSEDAEMAGRLGKGAAPNTLDMRSTSWSGWNAETFTTETTDLVLFDFTGAEGLPTAIDAFISPEAPPKRFKVPVVLLMDIQQSARDVLQTLVEEQGVTVMASQTGADPEAFQAFLGSILIKRAEDTKLEPSPQTPLPVLPQVLPALRNPNGRLDARRISRLFGIPLRRLAVAIGADEAAVYKTSDAQALQEKLRSYERIAKALLQLVGSEEGLRIWLNTPEQELDNEIPRELLLSGEGEVVAELLEDMLKGQAS